MIIRWFIARHGDRVGPFTSRELIQMARLGLLGRDEWVWAHGTSKWVAATNVPGLFPTAGQKPPSRSALSQSQAQLLVGNLEFEEAKMHIEGKEGDQLAKLISTLKDLQRSYSANEPLVNSLEDSIQILQNRRAGK